LGDGAHEPERGDRGERELMVRRPVTVEESEDKPHVYPIWSDQSIADDSGASS
jgi:hypothetical protein